MKSTMIERAVIAAVILTGLAVATPAFADYTVAGRCLYQDRPYTVDGFTGGPVLRPIRYADVQVKAGATVLTTGSTGADGSFSINVPGSTAQSIQAVCMATATVTPGLLLDVKSTTSTFSFGSIYTQPSVTVNALGTGSVNFGDILAMSTTTSGAAFNIWDVLVDGLEFVASPGVNGSFPTTRLTALYSPSVQWFPSFYNSTNKSAYIGYGSGYDDSVISQQFGNFVLNLFSKQEVVYNPYGPLFGGDEDIRVAWSDGFATFFGASIRQFKGYPNPEVYLITDGTKRLLSFEIVNLTSSVPFTKITGSTNMLAVCRSLWNITNGVLHRPFSDVWRVLTTYMTTLVVQGATVEHFWDGWFAGSNGNLAEMQTIFAVMNGIEFIADSLEPDDTPATASAAPVVQLPPPAKGSKVVINEIIQDGVGVVELYNAGDTAADLTGWIVSAIREGYVTANKTMPAFQLKPRQFVTIYGGTGPDSSSIMRFGATIPWAQASGGACSLRNSIGFGMDFVRWGDSRELPPGGTSFTGATPQAPPGGKSLGRDFSGTDTDSASDWTANTPTFGTFNVSGQEKHHTFYPANDVDFVSFNATAGRNYLIETLNLANGADTVLNLLSNDGATVLGPNDDYGQSVASQIFWTPQNTGQYYVRCSRYDKALNLANYGSYDLRIIESSSALAIPVQAILTVSKAGNGGQYQTVSDAISAASSGDIVQIIDNSTYSENLSISGKSLTLRAASGNTPVIDGSKNAAAGSSGLAVYAKDTKIQALTFIGGAQGIVVTGGNATIVDTVVARASDSTAGDGIEVVGSSANAKIIHCTVVYNKRVGVGAFLNGTASIVNSITYGNTSADIGGDSSAAAHLTARYTLVAKIGPGIQGNHLLNLDPRFVNSGANDYHLQSSSPAIDLADSTDPDEPANDIQGLPRNLDGGTGKGAIPDMGAYEYLNPASFTTTTVFSQIAAGGTSPPYQTSIVGVNANSASAIVQVSLAKSDGTAFPVSGGDSLVVLPALAPMGMARVEVAGASTLNDGYAKMSSSIPITGTALFKTMSGNRILSEAGVGVSKQTKNFTVYIDNRNNASSGYAIANAGMNDAHLTLTLRDNTGSTVGAPQSFTILAGQHKAEFAYQRFSGLPAEFEGTVEFSSDQDVASVALRYDNTNLDSFSQTFSTIPVLVDEANTTLYFPHLADGGSYRTNFILVNNSTTDATARLDFFGDNGTPLSLPLGGSPTPFYNVTLPAKSTARLITDGTTLGTTTGWARVTSTAPIGGSSIFQTVGSSRIISEAGVSSSPQSTHFLIYVSSLGTTMSGLAISNPNSTQVNITLNLRDATSGQIVKTGTLSLPPLGHRAAFFSGPGQLFPDVGNVEGMLEVIASAPVSGVALRYDNTNLDAASQAFATLPVIIIP